MPRVAVVWYSNQSRREKEKGFHILEDCPVSEEIDEDYLCLATLEDAQRENIDMCNECKVELRRPDSLNEIIRRASFKLWLKP